MAHPRLAFSENVKAICNFRSAFQLSSGYCNFDSGLLNVWHSVREQVFLQQRPPGLPKTTILRLTPDGELEWGTQNS